MHFVTSTITYVYDIDIKGVEFYVGMEAKTRRRNTSSRQCTRILWNRNKLNHIRETFAEAFVTFCLNSIFFLF